MLLLVGRTCGALVEGRVISAEVVIINTLAQTQRGQVCLERATRPIQCNARDEGRPGRLKMDDRHAMGLIYVVGTELLRVDIAERRDARASGWREALEEGAAITASPPYGEDRPVAQYRSFDGLDAVPQDRLAWDGMRCSFAVVTVGHERGVTSGPVESATPRNVSEEEEEILALFLPKAAVGVERRALNEPSGHQERALAKSVQHKLRLTHRVRPCSVAWGRLWRVALHLASA